MAAAAATAAAANISTASTAVAGNLSSTERTPSRRGSTATITRASNRDYASSVAWYLADLEKGSSLFHQYPPPPAPPHFDPSEVEIGSFLGEGEFGVVREVAKFINIPDKCTCWSCTDSGDDGKPQHQKQEREHQPSKPITQIVVNVPLLPPSPAAAANDGNKEEGHKRMQSVGSRVSFAAEAVTMIDEEEEWLVGDQEEADDADDEEDDEGARAMADRGYMAQHFTRNGQARYAIKQLKDDVPRRMREDAAFDIASEAKFLAALRHPNILRLRGLVGTPGHPSFALILDRLYSTLVESMEQWKKSQKRFRGFLGRFGKKKAELEQLQNDRLVALFDVARAMRYLHDHKILYRDIKPDNIGFDVRGDAKLYDFGLAKELLPRDLVTPPDSYRATGITGSRRYMAPEVVMCKDYGLSADVFGYGILFWEVMALKTPFAAYNVDQHFTEVVVKGVRPKGLPFLSRPIHSMMEECWSHKPEDRPSFDRICECLRAELSAISAGFGGGNLTNRSSHLMDTSWSSRYGAGRTRLGSAGSSARSL